jgi:hypothetical protein
LIVGHSGEDFRLLGECLASLWLSLLSIEGLLILLLGNFLSWGYTVYFPIVFRGVLFVGWGCSYGDSGSSVFHRQETGLLPFWCFL